MEVAPTEPIWSDFIGSGANQGDYINGASKTTSAMNMDYAWKDGVSFGDPCVQMKLENEYALEPTDCSGPAKFICMKTVCPDGFQWYDMKTCAKTMDSAASKDDAIAASTSRYVRNEATRCYATTTTDEDATDANATTAITWLSNATATANKTPHDS